MTSAKYNRKIHVTERKALNLQGALHCIKTNLSPEFNFCSPPSYRSTTDYQALTLLALAK